MKVNIHHSNLQNLYKLEAQGIMELVPLSLEPKTWLLEPPLIYFGLYVPKTLRKILLQ
jgi:hypothetical protein